MIIGRSLLGFIGMLLLAGAGCSNGGFSPSSLLPNTESAEEVRLESGGRAVIVGSFYPAPAPNSPAVLLLHQWQSDRSSWDEFARRLQSKGIGVLSIDGRGFGDSVTTSDGRQLAPNANNESVQLMLGDVDKAFKLLQKQKNVDPERVGIAGASYGSSLAIMYAAEHPEVKALALLSPGMNYFGSMPIEEPAKNYGGRALYIIAATGDEESAYTVGKLGTMPGGDSGSATRVIQVTSGSAHGTDLFAEYGRLSASLEGYFRDAL
ncbi:MAG: alpha/beta fold hydrolase [Aridibacter famidurans]|nr:alpha/beta fold hydrolase [Aridibacter famidurans]